MSAMRSTLRPGCAAAAEPRQVLAIADDIVHLYTDIVSVPAGRREIPGVEDPVDVVAIRR